MAIPRPTNVAINTPPRDRNVIPSESSRTGHKLRRVLFQYLPRRILRFELISSKTILDKNLVSIMYSDIELKDHLTVFQNNGLFVVPE